MLADIKKTQHMHTCTRTLKSFTLTPKDETTRSRNNIQRASEEFGFFFLDLCLVSDRVQRAEFGLFIVFLVFQSHIRRQLNTQLKQSTVRSGDSGTAI